MSTARKIFQAQPGPQTEFLADPSDIVIFGGAAGGGKTRGVLYDQVRWSHVPAYRGVIFRRTYPEITGPGALWDESQEVMPYAGGIGTPSSTTWRFPSGAAIKFSHMQHATDRFKWQGSQLANIAFEELTHFEECQFNYLASRNRSTCGVRPYIRATTNPDPTSWVAKYIEWWLDSDGLPDPDKCKRSRYLVTNNGELTWYDEEPPSHLAPLRVRFIPSRLEDNPALLEKDPDYLRRLKNLTRVDRARLLDGNWHTLATAGSFFKRAWFAVIPAEAFDWAGVTSAVRYWDRAATEVHEGNKDPDWTAGVLMCRMKDGRIVIADVVRLRGSPEQVRATIIQTAKVDGPGVVQLLEQDPGQAGVVEIASYRSAMSGGVTPVLPRGHKADRLKPLSAAAERGEVSIVNAPWTRSFLNEAEAFLDNREAKEPPGYHDDQMDGGSGAYNHLSNPVHPRVRQL